MFAVQVMIDSKIDLITIDVRTEPEKVFDTLRSPDPSVVTPVQAVVLSEVIRQRHLLKHFRDESRRIKSRPQRVPRCEDAIHIPPKQIERLQRPGCSDGLD